MAEPDKHEIEDPAEFRRLAEQVLGQDWIQRLARALNVNLRTAQRWATRQRVVSPRAWSFLREQAARVEDMRLEERILELADLAERRGISPHVVTALLREVADQVRDRIPPTIKPRDDEE
ncbi:hypothetical protein AAII07_55300 [Microvirga sp. 0TCS3.31]